MEFVGLEERDDRVRVRLRSEERGEYERDVQWVVGTDGYHSAVRDATGDQFDGDDHPQLWGVFDTELIDWAHPRDVTCMQLQPPTVLPFPLGKSLWRIYFIADSGVVDPVAAAGGRLARISPEVCLENAGDPQYFRAHSRVARRYRIGRVFLAGDAAHASNPIEGHGMNAGIQDAYNLGWKLAYMVSGTATERLIESYEAERQAIDRDIVRSGDMAYGRMVPAADEAREDLVDFLNSPKGPKMAALASSEIAAAYRKSPIVADVGTPATCRLCALRWGAVSVMSPI